MSKHSRQTHVGKIARDYCTRFPMASNLQLARMLVRDQPIVFASIDQARCAVRYYRGAQGDSNRRDLDSDAYCARYDIPEPEPPTWGIYELPTDVERWLILADVHVPFHSAETVGLAIEHAKARKTRCDGIILLGDFMDFYGMSHWERDPRVRDPKSELNAAMGLLGAFTKQLRPKHVVWKCGNHENRLETYLMRRAAEFLQMTGFRFEAFLKEQDAAKNVQWVPSGWPIQHGKLYLLHGHEWKGGMSSPVNPARGAQLKLLECAVVGHQHRTSQHVEPTLSGTSMTTWSIGCACDLHPAYSPLNRWNAGVATLTAGTDWQMENYRVINGKLAS